MTQDTGTRAAWLLAARRSGLQIAEALAPIGSESEAYAVQDAVVAQLGQIGAWKVGAKGVTAVPTCAPIPAAVLHPSPAVLPAREFHMIGIEAELAFQFARGFEPGARAIPAEEILAGVSSLRAAIEVVDTRLEDWRSRDRLWLLADCQMNGGLVCGGPSDRWRGQALDALPIRLEIDGATRVEARGGNPAGDPVRLLVWLVNHVCQQRGGLAAGTIVTTGSCTGMIFVEPGAHVAAEFAGFEPVSISFAL